MNVRGQSTLRIFVFLGLAVVILQFLALVILTPWIRPHVQRLVPSGPMSGMTLQDSLNIHDPALGYETTGGEWVLARETPLRDVRLKEYCRGQYSKKYAWEAQENVHCVEEYKLTAQLATEADEYIVVYASSTYGQELRLDEAKQLGTGSDPNARVLLQVSGLQDCENEGTGCGYNYTVKLADLHQAQRVIHLANSDLFESESNVWNATFTTVVGFIGMCDPACVPEPIYAWKAQEGVRIQVTQDTAYLDQSHYEQRSPDVKNDPYVRWGKIRWVNPTTVEIERIDAQGKVTKLRRSIH